MINFFTEAFESPGFWILAGGGIAMVLLGWIISKRTMEFSLPLWQVIVSMIGIVVASAYFTNRG